MKRIILISFLLSLILTSCVSSDDNKKAYPFITSYDEFNKITFTIHKYFTNHNSPINLYIGQSETNIYLRCAFSYEGKDWIFFNNMILINELGDKVILACSVLEKKTDTKLVGSTLMVYEKNDIPITKENEKIFEKLFNGSSVKLRLGGNQIYHDYELSDDAISAIRMILKTYDEKLNPSDASPIEK
jgi:hypothetical protein